MKTPAIFLLAATAILPAQDLPYDSGSTGADGAFTVDIAPGLNKRRYFAATYDAARGETLVYGGGHYRSWPSNFAFDQIQRDTWAWKDNAWVQKEASGAPNARYLTAMAYHPSSQLTVLYGGVGRADTYTWDGTTWTNATNATPGVVGYQGMAHDGNPGVDEVIMFGGWNGGAALNTTWAWDGTTWTNKNPANKPTPRYHVKLAWDGTRNEIILFGGWDRTNALSDTWIWKDGNWTEKSPATVPPGRYDQAIGHDPVSGMIIMHGGWTASADGPQAHGDTWAWDGTNWTEISTTKALTARAAHMAVTNTDDNELLLIGGFDYRFGEQDDTWRWDSTANGGSGDWIQIAGSRYMIDMAAKPDGIWNFTSVNVPAGVTVEFVPNAANTPVIWLASEEVDIQGTLSVNGTPGNLRNNVAAMRAPGGPGGFAGGIGGTRDEVFNSTSGTPGLGPAGGAPGITPSQAGSNGGHQSLYGNPYLVPLVGGSGGGGGAATTSDRDGGNGGGGGGAILIASSRDITVNGRVSANGGYFGQNTSFNGTRSGNGAGGGIKLVADRIAGSGTLEAKNGQGTTTGTVTGYIRLESYLKPFNISGTVTTSARADSAPIMGLNFTNPPTIAVTNVAGANVAQPPSGSFNDPDVIFTEAGPITITVTTTNVPDGTPVTARVTTPTGTINLPETGTVTVTGGSANFTATVPAGFGTIQAFVTYDVTPD